MRTIENFPTDLSVAKPVAVVRVGGSVLANVGEVTVTRGSGTAGLPSALVDGGTSRAGAEFTVNPAPGKRSVWPSGTPARGTSVTIDTGYEGATARRFTGVVDYCEGGVGEAATVHCVDLSDLLRRRVQFDPLLEVHPNHWAASHRPGLCPGLMSTHFVAKAARRSGFHAGPAPTDWDTTRLFVPLNGSAWAYSGRTDKANRMDGSAPESRVPTPWYQTDPWGSGPQSLHARYAPTNIEFPEAGYRARPSAGAPLRLAFMVGTPRPTSSDYSRIVASWPGGANVNIGVHPTSAYVTVALSNGRTVPALAAGTGAVVQVTIESNGTVTAETAGLSQSSTGTLPAGTTTTDVSEVEVRVPEGGRAVGYLNLWNSASIIDVDFQQTAILDGRSANSNLRASPTIDKRALDMIDEIADAELSAMWLDEDGRLILRHRTTLETQPVARTLTATRDLAPYRWREEWGAQRSACTVGWSQVSTRTSFWYPTVTVWQGHGDTRRAGDGSAEDLIHPPSGEEWIDVSLPVLGYTSGNDQGVLEGFPSGFEAGYHSWALGVRDHSNGNETWQDPNVTIRKIDPRTFVVEYGAEWQDISLRVPDEPYGGYRVKPRWRGEKTPILRARAKSVMVDQETSVTGGPPGASVLMHEGGWLVQSENRAAGLGNLLMARCMSPIIAIPSVSILPDPRVQQYDRLRLRDDIDAETEWDVLVTGYREHLRPAEGVYEQSLDIQVLSMTDRGVTTYGMVDQSWAGNTYNQVEAENPSTTYQQFENDPWKG